MDGRIVGGSIVLMAAAAGAALYYFQVYHYYEEVAAPVVELTLIDGTVEPILAEDVQAIDAASSPIRYRACFATPLGLGTLTETYRVHPDPEPLRAPPWFDCFDAGEIARRMEAGRAVAFTGRENTPYGIDRVVVVDDTGRGWAWDQINRCGARIFDGDPVPEGCPPPPARLTEE
jgi:hypothetical protein